MDVCFDVILGKTIYIGRLVCKVPDTLYQGAEVKIEVEDTQDSTGEAIKEGSPDVAKEVLKKLMLARQKLQ
jgi:hypothetical protein